MKFEKKFEARESGGDYLQLKAGESVEVVFRGDLHEFDSHWVQGKGSVICEGPSCSWCESGEKPKFRFKVNAVMKENAALVAKVWEQGQTVYEQLSTLSEEYDLESTKVKVTRHGEGMDTTYSVLPVRGGELAGDVLRKVEAVAINHWTDSGTPGKF